MRIEKISIEDSNIESFVITEDNSVSFETRTEEYEYYFRRKNRFFFRQVDEFRKLSFTVDEQTYRVLMATLVFKNKYIFDINNKNDALPLEFEVV